MGLVLLFYVPHSMKAELQLCLQKITEDVNIVGVFRKDLELNRTFSGSKLS